MTDLATEVPHVVAPERPIDDALRDMIAFGVRLLLVVRDSEVIGIITSYDIMGERPLQFLQDPFRGERTHRHADVRVEDVMTRIDDTRPLRHRWVSEATAGEVAALFRARSSDTHLLVVEEGRYPGEVVVRGIFSRTRLERQLGAPPR
ncbi:MAG TPA: CBS domain-containing protein [Steroidobacteraceae bacterium]|nr:CBS domain-containing protein [Steroidobacteraceae bacterium]